MLDVRRRASRSTPDGELTGDVRAFVTLLERWLIDALSEFGVRGETRPDRVGVWVRRPDKGEGREDKIAAIGIRLKRWVSLHGVSLNVEPDLSHFAGIVPCGITAHGVTSLVDLGIPVSMTDADVALRRSFERGIGSVR
jgi:lipoyl(octanoyl) transferase